MKTLYGFWLYLIVGAALAFSMAYQIINTPTDYKITFMERMERGIDDFRQQLNHGR